MGRTWWMKPGAAWSCLCISGTRFGRLTRASMVVYVMCADVCEYVVLSDEAVRRGGKADLSVLILPVRLRAAACRAQADHRLHPSANSMHIIQG